MTKFVVGQTGDCTKCGWSISASSDRDADFRERVDLHEEREGHIVVEESITSKHPIERSWIKVHRQERRKLIDVLEEAEKNRRRLNGI